jgi:hypothetical protein
LCAVGKSIDAAGTMTAEQRKFSAQNCWHKVAGTKLLAQNCWHNYCRHSTAGTEFPQRISAKDFRKRFVQLQN